METLTRRHPVHRRTDPTVKTLSLVVTGWWLLLAGAVIWVMPEPEASARPTPTSTLIGQDATGQASIRPEWITVTDSQPVRIVAADGEAVRVELLNGAYAGQRGWTKQRDLGPVD